MEFPSVYEIGRVLRASTEGFTCGTRSQELEFPSFGAFVQTTHSNGGGDLTIIGLITAVRIEDDPLVRQLIMASTSINDATLLDQRANRMVPVEIDVLNVGYIRGDRPYYNMPPRPPMSLDIVQLCEPDYVEFFTEGLDFLRLILNAGQLPTTDLLGAAIRQAAQARPGDQQREFLVAAGRRLAALLSHDLTTLQQVLQMIRP